MELLRLQSPVLYAGECESPNHNEKTLGEKKNKLIIIAGIISGACFKMEGALKSVVCTHREKISNRSFLLLFLL